MLRPEHPPTEAKTAFPFPPACLGPVPGFTTLTPTLQPGHRPSPAVAWGKAQRHPGNKIAIRKDRTGYLAKYLSKDRTGGLKRWRLWAAFGTDWEWTKVANIEIESLYSTIYRALAECYRWKGNTGFRERSRTVSVAPSVASEGGSR